MQTFITRIPSVRRNWPADKQYAAMGDYLTTMPAGPGVLIEPRSNRAKRPRQGTFEGTCGRDAPGKDEKGREPDSKVRARSDAERLVSTTQRAVRQQQVTTEQERASAVVWMNLPGPAKPPRKQKVRSLNPSLANGGPATGQSHF